MTSYLPLNSYRKLVSGLEVQGVGVKKIKAGWVFRFKSGETQCLHISGSDSRGLRNFRSDVEREGLLWPLDKNFKRQFKTSA